MPRHNTPADVASAARAHVRARHNEELPDVEIGRPTARAKTVRLTWAEDEELGLYFDCRRCPDGFRRYYLEVERAQPTERLYVRAATHFAEQHPEQPLAPQALWHEGNRPEGPLASFLPMMPQLGAGIVCQLCPQGMNRIFLTTPPYGDARRLQHLLSEQPELYEKTRGFESRERAEYVDAWDRGELQRRDRFAGRQALARAATEREPRDARQEVLVALLLQRAPDGKGITRLIDELDWLALKDPVAFSCELATAIPGLAELAGNVARDDLARAVARHLGCGEGKYPTTNASELWRLKRAGVRHNSV
jgi:hypothetical protein